MKVRILLVDDMPGTAKLSLARLLAKADQSLEVEFRVVKSGMDAIQAMEAELPDCVISDFRMDHIDGLELAFWTTQKFRLPILLMTGDSVTPGLLEEARYHGADSILHKPVDGRLLAGWVKRHATPN